MKQVGGTNGLIGARRPARDRQAHQVGRDRHPSVRSASTRSPSRASSLLTICSALTSRPVDAIVAEYDGRGYGDLKKDLAEVVLAFLSPFQGACTATSRGRRSLARCSPVPTGRRRSAAPTLERVSTGSACSGARARDASCRDRGRRRGGDQGVGLAGTHPSDQAPASGSPSRSPSRGERGVPRGPAGDPLAEFIPPHHAARPDGRRAGAGGRGAPRGAPHGLRAVRGAAARAPATFRPGVAGSVRQCRRQYRRAAPRSSAASRTGVLDRTCGSTTTPHVTVAHGCPATGSTRRPRGSRTSRRRSSSPSSCYLHGDDGV